MSEINTWLVNAAIFFVVLAFIISIASMIKFPSILIKLIVLEVITNLLMAGVALWALVNHQAIFIDICLTLALIMFLGIVAYYQFLAKGSLTNADP